MQHTPVPVVSIRKHSSQQLQTETQLNSKTNKAAVSNIYIIQQRHPSYAFIQQLSKQPQTWAVSNYKYH